MDAATITAIATPVVAILLGVGGVAKLVVDRHLAALTRLEGRAEETTRAQVQIAAILDTIREHMVDQRRAQERTARHVVRVLDHLGLSEHEPSEPAAAPAEIPPGRTVTGSYPSIRT